MIFALMSILVGCNNNDTTLNSAKEQEQTLNSANEVVLYSEVNWTPLNPARGDQSPQAGTLWGDRGAEVKTGFLVKFKEGFSSPPHIHNVTYRGIVIEGLIHNDDPEAAKMWMPSGSYWTQPAGEPHITAAKGQENMAFIEIQNGPYLVRPTEQAFDNGERPINVDSSNIVWVNMSDQSATTINPKVAYLWDYPNEQQLKGMLVKLPIGFIGKIESTGSEFRAVVIKGKLEYQLPNNGAIKVLQAGSYFSSKGKATHQIASKENEESIFYVRTNDEFEAISK
ncbi:MAG: DUF4437 domain-containing protein [Bacteroidota bacterium]